MADISKISPDNGTTIYNLKDIEARKRVPEVLLKDTVGWTGKNLLKYPYGNTTKTDNGITFTDNGDGSISLSGTATAQAKFYFQLRDSSYIPPEGEYCISAEGLTSGISIIIEGYMSTAWVKSIATITSASPSTDISIDYNGYDRVVAYLTINNGKAISSPITVYPMLRDASISDSTYEPYHESVEEVVGDIRAEQAVLGAKNLFGDIAENPKATNNATFTKSGNEYIISTAAQNNSGIYWQQGKLRDWFADKVGIRGILSFEIKGDSSFTVKVGEDSKNNRITCSTAYQKYEYVISDLSQIEAFVFYSQDTSNTHTLDIKDIMIRLATDPDGTYVPYAMTNRELTEKVQDIINAAKNANDFAAFKTAISSL